MFPLFLIEVTPPKNMNDVSPYAKVLKEFKVRNDQCKRIYNTIQNFVANNDMEKENSVTTTLHQTWPRHCAVPYQL